MKQSVGQIIRTRREKAGFDREQLAKKMKLSKTYLGQLECDSHVPLTPRIIAGLEKALGLKMSRYQKVVDAHNKRSKAWFKRYRENLKN